LNGKHGHFVTPAGTVAVKNWTLQFGHQWANSYNPVFSRAMEPWNPSFIRNLQKETSTDCSQTPGWSKPNKPQQPSPLAAPSRPVCLSPASQWQSCLDGNRMDSTGAAHAGKETQPSFRRTNHENKFSWSSIPKTKNKKTRELHQNGWTKGFPIQPTCHKWGLKTSPFQVVFQMSIHVHPICRPLIEPPH
jgi:hypothetical protein